MGRIVTEGETLVDLPEAKRMLGKSRATVFALIQAGHLMQVAVSGERTPYVTLASIEAVLRDPPKPGRPKNEKPVELPPPPGPKTT